MAKKKKSRAENKKSRAHSGASADIISENEFDPYYSSDFAYTAGGTAGGTPCGASWKEMEIDSRLPYEEKRALLDQMEAASSSSPQHATGLIALTAEVVDGDFSICSVSGYMHKSLKSRYWFAARVGGKQSLICLTGDVPSNLLQRDDGWRTFFVSQVPGMSREKILSDLVFLLDDFGIPHYALSSYESIWILIRKNDFERALDLLGDAGCKVKRQFSSAS